MSMASLGLGASRAYLLRIAAIKGDPGPSDAQVRIFLDGGAPIVVAAFEVQVLVVGDALKIEIAGSGRRGGDRKRAGLTFDVMREKRRAQTQNKSEDSARLRQGASH